MQELQKLFNPKEIEDRLYSYWESNGHFNAKRDESKTPYTIVIPPPNVTGVLHMGHGLNNTLQDILIRYKRMSGFSTLWMPGTDHAGIATQNVVERKLISEGTNRYELGREKFLERTWKVKEEHHAHITNQLRKMGCSPDWPRERFTMDEGLSKAVNEVFVKLYKEGLIYRGKYIINYCPNDRTALANDEVEYDEKDGAFYHIKYFFKDSDKYLEIATTRPETLLGDTAVAVNPDDERYKDIEGDTLILPLVGRELRLIKDSYVSLETGTGALKVTPAHDPNDYQLGLKHELEFINILNPDGTMNENVPEPYQGLSREDCRKKVVEDLEKEGFFVKKVEHRHQVGHCYRCGTVIEPYYSDQWFVRMKPLAEKALAAVENGNINIRPERWKKTYKHWMEEIRDWCISRQLWWGHRIPVWYHKESGEIYCDVNPPEDIENYTQDEDVLDTWFSSWLWPFSTLGWPEKNEDLKYFYPTSTLVTAFDILFFWVARMIMAGLYCMDEVPFKEVFIHGLVRDKQGRKMSKSLGNGIDPIEVINEYGADAFRFTIAFLTSLGQDVLLDSESFKMGFKFANKIWNSARFILSNRYEGFEARSDYDEKGRWIISRLQFATDELRSSLDEYRFDEAAQTLHKFFWSEFCDWYIEISKQDLYSDDKAAKDRTLSVLLHVLKQSLKLMHPIMPYISEEIWSFIKSEGDDALIVSDYPKGNDSLRDEQLERRFALMQELVSSIRNAYALFNIPKSEKLEITLRYTEPLWSEICSEFEASILSLSGAGSLKAVEGGERADGAYADVLEGAEMNAAIGSVIDIDAERTRLEKERVKIEADLEKTRKKLGNENFISRAKAEAVEKERKKENEFNEKIERINDILSSL